MRKIVPLLLLLMLSMAAWSQPPGGQPGKSPTATKSATFTANQAANIAVQRHGGRVLSISPQGNAYSVRLLLGSGKVIQVKIKPEDARR